MRWKFWVGLLISLFFLFIALRKIEFHLLVSFLTTANYLYLIPVVLIYYLSYAIRAFRWYYLMEPIKHIGFANLFSAIVIGFTANLLLPARIGEFVRAYHIGKTEDVSKSASFATIVIERLFDGFTILAFLIVVVIFLKIPEDNIVIGQLLKKGGYVSFLLYMVVIVFLWLLREYTAKVVFIIQRLFSFLPGSFVEKILNLLTSFAKGLYFFRGPRQVAFISAHSLVIWFLNVLAIYLTALAFDVSLTLIGSMFVLVMLVFGVMIPSAPGFVGTYHAACLYAFLFYNLPKEKALSIAIVMHATFFFSTIALGLFLIARQKMSLRDMSKWAGEKTSN